MSDETNSTPAAGLSTFGGVFTPSILTILGVIMYLRFGWVVGQVGLGGTLVIVTLSTVITLLTALSISAIATAQRVGGGGAYYMISRSLGIEPGGAIGVALYLAQALSVALYVIGFAESLARVFPVLDQRLVGMVTLVAVTLVAMKSARAAIKSQYVIMGVIVISLISLCFGGPVGNPADTTPVPSVGFWTVFAVFFPAVTGIMAGVNMSGDLADPRRSIPRGTLAAVGVGYVIYMGIPLLLSRWASPAELVADPLIMTRMAFWGDAILLGVWGATLSSAVGSILGAPRVLQALAKDGVLPRSMDWLGRGSGPDEEPRAGTAVTFALALVAVILGDLDLIAPILTMFFLTTYGILNVTAGLERFLGNPSYRPEFNVHWSLSLAGAVGCIWVMFLINPGATIVALVLVSTVYFWLERKEMTTAWGDVRSGIWMTLAHAGITRIRPTPDPKNWRPHLLLLSGSPGKRWHLVQLASELAHNRALLTVASVLPDDVGADRLAAAERTYADYLLKRGVQALVRSISAPSPHEGARRLVAAYGLGPLVPNTVMIGDGRSPESRTSIAVLIGDLFTARRNTIVVHFNDETAFGARQRIDVWWGGLRGNGSLMIILAHLISTSLPWRGAEVRLLMVVPDEEARRDAQANLEHIADRIRLGVLPTVIVGDGRPFDEILRQTSEHSDLVLLGLREPDTGFEDYFAGLHDRLRSLPTTMLVLAAEDVVFGEVLLESDDLEP